MEIRDFLGSAFGILAVLSTLLIFVISWWIVLLINIAEIIILLCIFGDMESSKWVYVAEFIVCIGVMILVMIFPDKVCGGTMARVTDKKSIEYLRDMLMIDDKNATLEDITARFRTFIGIGFALLIIFMIIDFIILIRKDRFDGIDSYTFYLAIPLSCMCGITLFNFNGPIMVAMMFGVTCGVILTVAVIISLFSDDSGGSGGGGGKTYHVFIVED